ADGERTLVPVPCLFGIPAVPPEAPDRAREHQRAVPVAALTGIPERLADVVLLHSQAVVPLALLGACELRFRLLDQAEVVVEMPAAELGSFCASLEQLSGVLANRLQHQKTSLAD